MSSLALGPPDGLRAIGVGTPFVRVASGGGVGALV
jgi:hypothetical protein